MSVQQDNFFATQIAQKQQEQKGRSQQREQHKQEQPKQQLKPPVVQKYSLKALLNAFNSYDKRQQGVISIQQMTEIINSYQLNTQQVHLYYKLSLPIFADSVTFDQFLFVFGLCQTQANSIDQQIQFGRTIDNKLIDFLKLLNNYRKKVQKVSNYKQAKKSKSKIQQIRQRQLMRRKNYLNVLHQRQIMELQQRQKSKFLQFCSTWDQFMIDYQNSGVQLVNSMRNKHQAQYHEYYAKTKQELASKHHPSKQILELMAIEKNLVKFQSYQKAQRVRQQIKQLQQQESIKKLREDQSSLQMKCSTLRKKQQTELNNLLQKIQKDRNDQLKQRQIDSQKLIIRNKTLITQINHRHTDCIKKVYEGLHNISLDMGSMKTIN